MHISQFEVGDIIRHSSYPRNFFATVESTSDERVKLVNADGDPFDVTPLANFHPEPYTDDLGGFLREGDEPGPWEDSQWAYVTPQWFDGDCTEEVTAQHRRLNPESEPEHEATDSDPSDEDDD